MARSIRRPAPRSRSPGTSPSPGRGAKPEAGGVSDLRGAPPAARADCAGTFVQGAKGQLGGSPGVAAPEQVSRGRVSEGAAAPEQVRGLVLAPGERIGADGALQRPILAATRPKLGAASGAVGHGPRAWIVVGAAGREVLRRCGDPLHLLRLCRAGGRSHPLASAPERGAGEYRRNGWTPLCRRRGGRSRGRVRVACAVRAERGSSCAASRGARPARRPPGGACAPPWDGAARAARRAGTSGAAPSASSPGG